jgi:hypothetical protein
MAANEIRKNDVGTIFYGTIYDTAIVNLSSATVKQIILLKPDTTVIQKDASFVTDGTDGKLSYTTVAGDLSCCGIWKVQWLITLSSGTWYTDIKTFKVYSNLN